VRWYRALYANVRVGRGVSLGRNVDIRIVTGGSLTIGAGTIVEAQCTLVAEGELVIGENSFIGFGAIVVAAKSVRIGKDALIAAYTTIRDQDHRFDDPSKPYRLQGLASSPVVIGDNVWLGTKTTVLKGVRIGDNSIVGANSVVTSNVPEDPIVAGGPARPIRSVKAETNQCTA
jgi:acetyltransferase-like isoleucine patch superfamily enzyme